MSTAVSNIQRHETKPKSAKVKITARTGTVEPVDFSMDAHFPDQGGKQDKDALKFDKHAGPFELTFTLDDKTSLGLGFYPDVTQAMWVAAGSSCPAGPGNGGGVISPVSVVSDTLTVMNANEVEETLTFALHFTGESNGKCPPYSYDPQIKNGGGR